MGDHHFSLLMFLFPILLILGVLPFAQFTSRCSHHGVNNLLSNGTDKSHRPVDDSFDLFTPLMYFDDSVNGDRMSAIVTPLFRKHDFSHHSGPRHLSMMEQRHFRSLGQHGGIDHTRDLHPTPYATFVVLDKTRAQSSLRYLLRRFRLPRLLTRVTISCLNLAWTHPNNFHCGNAIQSLG